MSKLSSWFAAGVVLALPWLLHGQAPSLPPGPMQGKATTACTECHEARIILQQRLSRAAWVKEVDKMIRWGALVNAKDHDALVDYLSANFSPDKTAEQAERLPAAKKGQSGRWRSQRRGGGWPAKKAKRHRPRVQGGHRTLRQRCPTAEPELQQSLGFRLHHF